MCLASASEHEVVQWLQRCGALVLAYVVSQAMCYQAPTCLNRMSGCWHVDQCEACLFRSQSLISL